MRNPNGMRVLLADNHVRVRWALRTYLREELGLEMVAEVADATALLAEARTSSPDLILVEWDLPGEPMEGVLELLRDQGLHAHVVVLSRRPECERAALAAGADVFVCKAGPPGQLGAALHDLIGAESPPVGNRTLECHS
jgi:DNA-binding NarL/FixJ family response regulator